MLVKTAHQYEADISFECNGHRANAKSLLGILTLGAGQGTKVVVTAQGFDAAEALLAIQELFASDFHEAKRHTVMTSPETVSPLVGVGRPDPGRNPAAAMAAASCNV